MKKQHRFSLPAVGAGSLLTVFAVLCLTVFALLSLTSVRAEQRLSEAAAETAAAWYQADTQAQEIFARLRSGEMPAGVREDNHTFYYACPISHSQQLAVALKKDSDAWKILRWQAMAPEQTGEETIPVWRGEGGTP